jgi:hypothetical protein
MPSRIHAVVLMSQLHKPTLQALAYAWATSPATLTALTVMTDRQQTHRPEREWVQRGISIPLTVIDAPYRDITSPVVEYVARLRTDNPRTVVVVYVPEYVVGHWWVQVLHNQRALRLQGATAV